MFEICLGAAATVITVFVIYMHRSWMSDTPLPSWLSTAVCMNKRKPKVSTSAAQTDYVRFDYLRISLKIDCLTCPNMRVMVVDVNCKIGTIYVTVFIQLINEKYKGTQDENLFWE